MDITYTYTCDAGSLKVGNDEFQMLIGNGYGDGCFNVTISDEQPEGDWEFVGSFQGKNVNIYSYDCASHPIHNVTGTVHVYRNYGYMYLYVFKDKPNHFGNMEG